MLSAVPIGSKEPIAAYRANGQNSWVCPDCLGEVYLRRRYGWTDHFCHKVTGCSTKLVSRDSYLHDLGKQLLVERLSQVFNGELFGVQTEQSIGDRRADVAVRMGERMFLVAECQLSAIGIRELESRSRDYLSYGVSVSWWFSPSSLSLTVKHWCEEFFGKGKWEEISHPQLKLTGYIPDLVLEKKQMSQIKCKSTGDLLLDLIGVESAKELVVNKLNDAIANRDSSGALQASALWTKLDGPIAVEQEEEVVEQPATLFPLPSKTPKQKNWAAKGSMVYTHQILWLLNREPANIHKLLERAEQVFNFSEQEMEIKKRNGMSTARWIGSYENCLYSLVRYYQLVEEDKEALFSYPKEGRGRYYKLTAEGQAELKQLNNSKTLPLKATQEVAS